MSIDFPIFFAFKFRPHACVNVQCALCTAKCIKLAMVRFLACSSIQVSTRLSMNRAQIYILYVQWFKGRSRRMHDLHREIVVKQKKAQNKKHFSMLRTLSENWIEIVRKLFYYRFGMVHIVSRQLVLLECESCCVAACRCYISGKKVCHRKQYFGAVYTIYI